MPVDIMDMFLTDKVANEETVRHKVHNSIFSTNIFSEKDFFYFFSVLRSYAGFLIGVLNCQFEASMLLQRADDLEEQATRNVNSNGAGARSGATWFIIRNIDCWSLCHPCVGITSVVRHVRCDDVWHTANVDSWASRTQWFFEWFWVPFMCECL